MQVPEDVIAKIMPDFSKALEAGKWDKGLRDMIS
jgi:hypothetical protein